MSRQAMSIEVSMNLQRPHEIVVACEFGNVHHVDAKNGH